MNKKELAREAAKELANIAKLDDKKLAVEKILEAQLQNWDYIFIHLDEELPQNSQLHKKNKELLEAMLEMREHIGAQIGEDNQDLCEETELNKIIGENIVINNISTAKKKIEDAKEEAQKRIRKTIRNLELARKFFEKSLAILASMEKTEKTK
ncbi:hypothetical protein D6825_00790, partial [Candidatus Woesearchaeota archaeon]